MAKEEAIEVMAKVLETLPNAMFRVELKKVSIKCLRTFREKCASILFASYPVTECWLSFRHTILIAVELRTGTSEKFLGV